MDSADLCAHGAGVATQHARAAELADAFSGSLDAKYLLAVALELHRLDPDGILAMIAEAPR